MTINRSTLLESIATKIADYRAGEIDPPDAEHVDRWIAQFDPNVQLGMLAELNHVLSETYVSRRTVIKFLTALSTNTALAGANPCEFWKGVNFLDIQQGGNSQTEMLSLFSEILNESCGLETADCGSEGGPFVYLDDAIFTGNRIRNDLIEWLSSAPPRAKLHVIVMAFHRGKWYAESKINEACKAAGKSLEISWWRVRELEDRKTYINDSDVLRPRSIPADQVVQDYIKPFKYQPTLRTAPGLGQAGVFSSDSGRELLEQELLKAGVQIRRQSPFLGPYQRPLGNMVLETLGFGATLVTFRNCPNNCPLAFWAGDPWYPLFPRKTN